MQAHPYHLYPEKVVRLHNLEHFRKIRFKLDRSHNWYDFIVTVDGYPDFEVHLAGRVELTKGSTALTVSNPAMGSTDADFGDS